MTTTKKVKGTVLIKNIQDNKWGLMNVRQDKKDMTVRFLSAGLDKNITSGAKVTGVMIKQNCQGLVLDMVANITKTAGTKAKNVVVTKSTKKKKEGDVVSVDPETQSRTIMSNGTDFVDYGTTYFPVGTEVLFVDSGVLDLATGLIIATDVVAA